MVSYKDFNCFLVNGGFNWWHDFLVDPIYKLISMENVAFSPAAKQNLYLVVWHDVATLLLTMRALFVSMISLVPIVLESPPIINCSWISMSPGPDQSSEDPPAKPCRSLWNPSGRARTGFGLSAEIRPVWLGLKVGLNHPLGLNPEGLKTLLLDSPSGAETKTQTTSAQQGAAPGPISLQPPTHAY